MTARTFTRGPSIVVDSCEEHGTWFDAGELRAAAAAAARAAPTAVNPDGDGNGNSGDERAIAAQVNRRATAILDVSLALEGAHDEETARRAVDVAEDMVDTFNLFVLGRRRIAYGRRFR